MRRIGIAALLSAVVSAGMLIALRWPSTAPALDCPPDQVHLDDAGVARCGPGRPLAAAQVLTAGAKIDLNRATAEELAVIAGVGPQLAKAIVQERERRDGGFTAWDEVDQVSGVGDARLESLKASAVIR